MLFRRKTDVLKERVKELESQVYELQTNLIHDKLTGLKTRAFFSEQVNKYLNIISQQSELEKSGAPQRKEMFGFRNISLIFFDIDHFKKVNDQYGHAIGDEVLKKVSQTISASVRAGDTVARWGGEEIVVSLLGADENDAYQKAEEIRQKVEKLTFPQGHPPQVTISGGISFAENGMGLTELIEHADEALYKAKNGGRNRIVTYSSLHPLNQASCQGVSLA